MTKITFRQIDKQSEEDGRTFLTFMLDYINELDSNKTQHITSDETIKEYADGMIDRQGDFDRHLEFCYFDDVFVGFLYAKVDHVGHLGFIKPEYGCIMEFYVKPQYRCKGYGKAMFEHIQTLFSEHSIKKMYLIADPITGKQFWQSMGFVFSGEVSPENDLNIIERVVNIDNNIIIEPIGKLQLEFIYALANNSILMDIFHDKSTTKEEWNNNIEIWENDQDEKDYVIIRNYDGEKIGWIGINGLLSDDMIGWIKILAIYPKYWNNGYGSKAIQEIKRIFKLKGFKKIQLWTDGCNKRAQMCYKSNGFNVVDNKRDQVGSLEFVLDRVLMSCSL